MKSDLEAAKGKAIREYYEFMSQTLHPQAKGEMDTGHFYDVQGAKGVASWKLVPAGVLVIFAVWLFFFR